MAFGEMSACRGWNELYECQLTHSRNVYAKVLYGNNNTANCVRQVNEVETKRTRQGICRDHIDYAQHMSLESYPIYSNCLPPPVQSFSKSDETPAQMDSVVWVLQGRS